jgi:ethanolaminephosphotransferase
LPQSKLADLDLRTRADRGRVHPAEEAVAECVSDDALIHLKSYKYSAVDKSPISHYILRPYVRTAPPPPAGLFEMRERERDRDTR